MIRLTGFGRLESSRVNVVVVVVIGDVCTYIYIFYCKIQKSRQAHVEKLICFRYI